MQSRWDDARLFHSSSWKCHHFDIWNRMEQHVFFAFWLIIEGDTEKVLQVIIQLKSIYNKNLCFVEQKMYFWTLQRVFFKQEKCFKLHYFCHNIFSNDLFRAACYRFMPVLHKDALFHWWKIKMKFVLDKVTSCFNRTSLCCYEIVRKM